ncbi:hypothetical protein LP416_27805 [Polaromonas sp. P2-4]|nr:hypothetical protein LP416_27805 [Polaromonas sp. P2-4]
MKVVKPIIITDVELVSSTAPETDYAAWDAGTDYAVGVRVIYGHKIWECVQTPNVGNTPGSAPLYWATPGPTNRWAMFDGKISTQTALASPLTVVVKPGYANSLSLFGLEGATLDVTVRNGLAGPVVYTKSISLDGTIIADWYQYFFEPSVQMGEVVLTDLPPYGDAHITATISGPGTVKCGHFAVGTFYDLGGTNYGVSIGILDYSRKDISASGATTLDVRDFANRMAADVSFANGQINKVHRVLRSLRATPCVYIGTDVPGYEPLTVFGFFRDFNIVVPNPSQSLCSIEIEGLT